MFISITISKLNCKQEFGLYLLVDEKHLETDKHLWYNILRFSKMDQPKPQLTVMRSVFNIFESHHFGRDNGFSPDARGDSGFASNAFELWMIVTA